MKLLAPIAIVVSLTGCAAMQPVSEADKNIEFITEAQNFTKDQIFTGSKVWIAENFKSAKAVIEYENKEEGVIIGNGSTSYPCSGMECLQAGAATDWKLNFTMRIDAKDNKFRTTFTNFTIYKPSTYNQYSGFNKGGDDSYIAQGAMPAIKAKLEAYPVRIKESLLKNNAKKDW
jgi:hypothetical protein